MKNVLKFEEFINESFKDEATICSELVEIAASYTDIDLTSNMYNAKLVQSLAGIIKFYDELCLEMKEELKISDFKVFQKESMSFLRKNGIQL